MKKVMFLAVLAVLLVSVFVSSSSVLADGEDNLKKAGRQALAEKEEVLRDDLRNLEMYVHDAAADRVVTKDEMIGLRDRVHDFTRAQKRFDERLADYGLKTVTVLDEGYEKALVIYFTSNVFFKKDIHGEVRRFFASMTGNDVSIERAAIVDGSVVFLAIILAGVFFLLMAGTLKTLKIRRRRLHFRRGSYPS